MKWHPLMVPRTELTINASPVGVEEGIENIMLVIEETVMPMMMDAVVRVATEMTEANRSSVIEDMFSKMEDQKKKLQFCFGSKLFPDAARMAPKFPAITCRTHVIPCKDPMVKADPAKLFKGHSAEGQYQTSGLLMS